MLAHQVAAIVRPGGHSFPLTKGTQGGRRDDPGGKGFLHLQADPMCGYPALTGKAVTGYSFPAGKPDHLGCLEACVAVLRARAAVQGRRH